MQRNQVEISYDQQRLQRWIVVALFLFLTIVSSSNRGFDGGWWTNWATYIHHNGLSNAYGSRSDYPPVYQYVLWFYSLLAGSDAGIERWVGLLRIFTYAAEFWSLWLVYKWTGRRLAYIYVLLLSFLNLAFSYNSFIWGQIDGMAAALVFASFYFLFNRRLILSAVFIVLSLNLKLQTVIFVPMWGLICLSSLYSKGEWKALVSVLAAVMVTQVLVLLPFAFGEQGVEAVWRGALGAVDASRFVRINAANIWTWVTPYEPAVSDQEMSIFGLNHNQVGEISFCLASAIVLWPIIRHTIRTFRNRETPPLRPEIIWLTGAAITLVFFFFNTRMHERYPHMAFIFITAYAFHQKRFGLYLLFSLAYFLSLEVILKWMQLENYGTVLFDGRFLAGLFLASLIWLVILLYRVSPSLHQVGAENNGKHPDSPEYSE